MKQIRSRKKKHFGDVDNDDEQQINHSLSTAGRNGNFKKFKELVVYV